MSTLWLMGMLSWIFKNWKAKDKRVNKLCMSF